MSFKGGFDIVWTTIFDLNDDNALTLAAALSFYTVFSVAPLFMILIAVAGLSGPATQEHLIEHIQSLVGSEAREVVTVVLQNALKRHVAATWSAAVGVIVLLFGATGAFMQLQYSLNAIWDVRTKAGQGIWVWVCRRLLSLLLIIGIGVVLFGSMVLSTFLTVFFARAHIQGAWQIAEFLITLGVYIVLFALVFKYLPDVKIPWSNVWWGAIITAILFDIGKFAIGKYLGYSSTASAYGAAGSLIILLLWVYYSSLIMFFGAELTHVYARSSGVTIEPAEYAERTRPEKSVERGA